MNMRLPSGGFVLCLLVGPAFGQTAGMLSFQALLKDGNGNPLPGPTADLVFRIYDDDTPGAPDNLIAGPFGPASAPGIDGVFTAKFGPVLPSAFDGNERWLEVTVDGTPLARIEMVTAPATAEQLNIPGTGTPALIVDGDGNIGIGTPSPGSPLTALDSTSTDGQAILGQSTATTGQRFGVYGATQSTHMFASGLHGRMTASTGSGNGVWGRSLSTSGTGVLGDATASSGSNYGVRGTTASLDGAGVYGEASSAFGGRGVHGKANSGSAYAGYFEGRGYFSGKVGIGTWNPGKTLDVINGTNTSFRVGQTASTSLEVTHFDSALPDVPGSAFGMQMIGPANAHVVLDIRGNDGADGFYVRVPTVVESNPTVDKTAFVVRSSGRVGIGTAAPSSALHVAGDNVFADGVDFVAGNGGGLLVSGGGIVTVCDENGTPRILLDGTSGGGMKITTRNLEATTSITTAILHITGADLAERFPVSEDVQAGMVMAIDPEHPGQLCLARGAYNRRVAGVVSGANNLLPGAILGHMPGHEDAPPIALSGRVWVHCDATDTPVQPGDLLTTSNTPGHAMKVKDHSRAQGAIIGKAMTSLESGKGLVLVLVSLQ